MNNEITLWVCSECGCVTDGRNAIHGPITSQAYCQGLPLRHKRIKMERVTFIPKQDIQEVVEAAKELLDGVCATRLVGGRRTGKTFLAAATKNLSAALTGIGEE